VSEAETNEAREDRGALVPDQRPSPIALLPGWWCKELQNHLFSIVLFNIIIFFYFNLTKEV
jgi:hypothetical protein